MKAISSIKEQLATLAVTTWITGWMAANPDKTRTRLAKALCAQLGLRDSKGAPRLATTAQALRDLEAEGCWTLPVAGRQGSGPRTPQRLGEAVPAPEGVPAQVEQMDGLVLVEVASGDVAHLRIWNELMWREHPLRNGRLVGRQLRYLIGSAHGWLGGVGFGSSALYLASRDHWIGWDATQRAASQERVINMTRFLIRDSVQCKNTASHVLGLCARRVAQDFERRYGVVPWLLETFVDRDRYDGTCYQAANWQCVGQTAGRGRNGGKHAGTSIKDVYVYPLVSDFRARMGVTPPVVQVLAPESGLDAAQWAAQEFGGCDLGDTRLTAQLVTIAETKGQQPSGSYARACGGDRHQLKSYYRLINNDRDQMSSTALLSGHRAQTIRRLAHEKTALIIQDTTDLNFSTRKQCLNLGLVGKNQTGTASMGLKMHSAVAVTTTGLPLGVLRIQTYAPEVKTEKADPHRPIEEKESYRWVATCADAGEIAEQLPHTRVVCIGDRESDLFELFDQRRHQRGHVDLLVRAKHDRCLHDDTQKLFAHMADGRPDGRVSLAVPRQREHVGKPSKPGRPALPARTAEVEVRFRAVTIRAPQTPLLKDKPPLALFAISLRETQPPAGATRIEWMLLTTIEVRSLKQAMRCVRWYCLRWRIEEWHRVLKGGCQILAHQNHSAEALTRTIAIDAVIAWRIMLLALLGRDVPEVPCSVLFDPWECEVLQLLAEKKTASPSGRP